MIGRVEKGKQGEARAAEILGIPKNSKRIPAPSGQAKYRIPDFMNESGRHIIEVKNVDKQGLTAQIKDDAAYVTRDGETGIVEIMVDTRTKISGLLQRAHNDPNSPISIRVEELTK